MSRTRPVLTSLLLCLLYPVVCFAYSRLIVPLYGNAVLGFHFDKVVLSAAAMAALAPIRIKRPQLILALLLAALPNTAFRIAVMTSRRGDATWGPVMTHAICIAPITFLCSCAVLDSLVSKFSNPWAWRGVSVAVLSAYHLSHIPSLLEYHISQTRLSDSTLLITSAGILLGLEVCALAQSRTVLKDQKKRPKQTASPAISNLASLGVFLLFLVPWIYIAPRFLKAPVLLKPLQASYQHPSLPIRILSSEQSITGTIVVGEGLRVEPALNMSVTMQDVRYLRADHSIIGGVWIGENAHSLDGQPAVRDSQGLVLGDSIYAAFVLQEAARLVPQNIPDNTGSALIIGLGAGVAAAAFQKHGLSTSIIEIDPAVYTAARTYFGLAEPNPDQVFLEDAGGWVHRRAASHQEGDATFNIIVHDCFSGGGVPEHIFTVDFWNAVKTIMSPEGVLAVNFAGIPASNSSRAILLTLEHVFGACRAYHDTFGPLSEAAYTTEFINIVFFCSASGGPIQLRPSRPADYLNSPLRRHILDSLPEREVNLSLLKKGLSVEEARRLILTKENNPLNRWQAAEALHHWSVMREVLSDFFWETY